MFFLSANWVPIPLLRPNFFLRLFYFISISDCLEALRGKKEANRYSAVKLCSTLKNKEKYVIHYRNLQTCLRQGLLLKKIHRGIKFTQSHYLKKYIDKCTRLRINAVSKFEKDMYKLMMNSVYGKFLQDNRKHFDVKICTDAKMLTKHLGSPLYKGHRIIDEKITAVYLNKSSIFMDRLYATGFSILDLSKDHMNRAWYDFIQPVLGSENVSLLLTDTDSFIIKVRNLSRKVVMDKLTPFMDFSNYPTNHPRYNTNHKAIPGYFKDETHGEYLTHFVGLKSKCYALCVRSDERIQEKIVCKGITKTGKAKINIEKYRTCLEEVIKIHSQMHAIRSKKNRIFTQHLDKVALSSFDDKRWLMECGIHSYPYGSVEYMNQDFSCALCSQEK